MIRYKAVNAAGVCPNLMTRFREEYYVPQAKKEKRKKASAPSVPEERERIRHEYFRKSSQGRYKVPKTQERLI